MDTFEGDAVVIGAGAVGLACARALALKGREVLVLEAGFITPQAKEAVDALFKEFYVPLSQALEEVK